MNPTTGKLLKIADTAIAAGASALANGFLEDAVGRAYYAMFYVADYGVDVELSPEEVEEMLTQAREFVDDAREFLNPGA